MALEYVQSCLGSKEQPLLLPLGTGVLRVLACVQVLVSVGCKFVCIFAPGCEPFQLLEATCSRKFVGEYPWCRRELPWGSLGLCGTMQGNKKGCGGK